MGALDCARAGGGNGGGGNGDGDAASSFCLRLKFLKFSTACLYLNLVNAGLNEVCRADAWVAC